MRNGYSESGVEQRTRGQGAEDKGGGRMVVVGLEGSLSVCLAPRPCPDEGHKHGMNVTPAPPTSHEFPTLVNITCGLERRREKENKNMADYYSVFLPVYLYICLFIYLSIYILLTLVNVACGLERRREKEKTKNMADHYLLSLCLTINLSNYLSI